MNYWIIFTHIFVLHLTGAQKYERTPVLSISFFVLFCGPEQQKAQGSISSPLASKLIFCAFQLSWFVSGCTLTLSSMFSIILQMHVNTNPVWKWQLFIRNNMSQSEIITLSFNYYKCFMRSHITFKRSSEVIIDLKERKNSLFILNVLQLNPLKVE